MSCRFDELSLADAPRRTIIVDIDGTLLAEGETDVAPEAKEALGRLMRAHDVYLCSNNVDPERSRRIARDLGASLIESRFRKPDPRLVEGITLRDPLVIGDKLLTDERFAHKIRAAFVKVKRVTSPKDPYIFRLIYAFDDAVAFLVDAMKRLT